MIFGTSDISRNGRDMRAAVKTVARPRASFQKAKAKRTTSISRLTAFAALAAFSTVNANAETHEDRYANVCKTKVQKSSADCVALKQLIEDEQAAKSARVEAESNIPPQFSDGTLARQWGSLGQLAGVSLSNTKGGITRFWHYEWEEFGKVLKLTMTWRVKTGPIMPAASMIYSLDSTTGKINTLWKVENAKPQTGHVEVLSDIEHLEFIGNSSRAGKIAVNADGLTLSYGKVRDGTVTAKNGVSFTRMVGSPLLAASLPDREGYLRQREQQRQAVALATAERQARGWGIVPQLVGQKFVFAYADRPDWNSVTTVDWVRPDESIELVSKNLINGGIIDRIVIQPNIETGLLEALNKIHGRRSASITSDGNIRIYWEANNGGLNRSYVNLYSLSGKYLVMSSYEEDKAQKKGIITTSLQRVTGSSDEALRLQFAKQYAEHTQRVEQARQVAQAEAPKKKGGGLLGALAGAAGAAILGGMQGADAGTTLGLALKGAAITGGGAALDAMGDTVIQGANPGMATNGGNSGGQAGASYPTKPNLAAGSCAGMTEANYRTFALSGGPDAQLKTMCGQAFEYYTMYKRAIAQGYSEADANRTYAAHEQAAMNVQNFLRNWGN